jgi:hypothetical protein
VGNAAAVRVRRPVPVWTGDDGTTRARTTR